MGLSTAYHLTQMGVKDVLVLERDETPILHSSGRSAGGLRLQFSSEVNIRLSQYSLERFENFDEEMGVPSGLHQIGYLFLHSNPEQWDGIAAQVELQKSLGVPVQVLSPEDIRELAPYVVVDDLLGATFCPSDGYADPYSVARGYQLRAQAAGVRILTDTDVIRVLSEGGRVTGVETDRGVFSGNVVLNAAGPWAGELGRRAGVEVPVEPYRRQIYVTTPFDDLPGNMPFTIDFATSAYCRREGDRLLLGMSDPDEPASFNVHTDEAFMYKMITTLVNRVPVLVDAAIHRGWGGLYEVTPDSNAIVGEHPDLAGFFLAVGFSGHGFQHAPAVGRVMAELISGASPFIDVSDLELARFRTGRLLREGAVV